MSSVGHFALDIVEIIAIPILSPVGGMWRRHPLLLEFRVNSQQAHPESLWCEHLMQNRCLQDLQSTKGFHTVLLFQSWGRFTRSTP
jgi:hypothetical protein